MVCAIIMVQYLRLLLSPSLFAMCMTLVLTKSMNFSFHTSSFQTTVFLWNVFIDYKTDLCKMAKKPLGINCGFTYKTFLDFSCLSKVDFCRMHLAVYVSLVQCQKKIKYIWKAHIFFIRKICWDPKILLIYLRFYYQKFLK